MDVIATALFVLANEEMKELFLMAFTPFSTAKRIDRDENLKHNFSFILQIYNAVGAFTIILLFIISSARAGFELGSRARTRLITAPTPLSASPELTANNPRDVSPANFQWKVTQLFVRTNSDTDTEKEHAIFFFFTVKESAFPFTNRSLKKEMFLRG